MARKRKKQQSIEKLKVKEKKARVNGSLGGDIVIFVFLCLLGAFMVFPLYYSVIQSMKPVRVPSKALCTESDYQQLLRYVQGSRKLMAGTAVKIYLQQLLYYNSNLYLQPFRLLLRSIRSCKV